MMTLYAMYLDPEKTTSNVRRCDSLHPRLWKVEIFLFHVTTMWVE